MISTAIHERRIAFAGWLLLATVTLTTAAAFADETYPAHPVRIIVPSAAGGGTDITARLIAQELSKSTVSLSLSRTGPARGR